MTAQAAVLPISSGATIPEISGATAGTDTVPAGCLLLARNTGAGVHTLVIGINYLFDGLPVNSAGTGSRTVSFAASGGGTAIQTVRVPQSYGDANGRVAIAVGEGTFAEVKYYVIAA